MKVSQSQNLNICYAWLQRRLVLYLTVTNKQTDGVALGSRFGPSLANPFLSYHEKNWLNSCPQGFKPVFYRCYVDDIFVVFKSNDHLKYFQEFLNFCLINMSFSMETERQNNFSFLDIEVIHEQGKFPTTIYRKPTFKGVYSNSESFLPSVYKFGMACSLVYRCFCISLDWKKFHEEVTFLKRIFRKNVYPENFIDKCSKKFLDNMHLVKEKVPTVERKRLLLVLPYLGVISLQTRTKLQHLIKGVLNCCKLENVKPSFPILSDVKTLYLKILYLELFINFGVASAMSPIMARVSDTYI